LKFTPGILLKLPDTPLNLSLFTNFTDFCCCCSVNIQSVSV
jgi:hypothetical protein